MVSVAPSSTCVMVDVATAIVVIPTPATYVVRMMVAVVVVAPTPARTIVVRVRTIPWRIPAAIPAVIIAIAPAAIPAAPVESESRSAVPPWVIETAVPIERIVEGDVVEGTKHIEAERRVVETTDT